MDDLFLDNVRCWENPEAPEKRGADGESAAVETADKTEAGGNAGAATAEMSADAAAMPEGGEGTECADAAGMPDICGSAGTEDARAAEAAQSAGGAEIAEYLPEEAVPEDGPQAEIRERRPSIFAANSLYLLAAAGLVLMQVLSEPLAMLLMKIFPAMSAEALLLTVNTLYYLPCLLLPAAIYAGRRDAWAGMRLSRAPKWRHVWRALLAAVVALPLGTSLSILWQMVLQACGLTVVEQGFLVPATAPGLLLMTLCLGLLPGVCEELAFRGMALGAWERRGSVRAILISSLMFASLHGSIAGFPVHFLLGCAIGVMAVGSGSIYTGMIFHGVYNSALLLGAYLAQKLVPAAEETAAAELMAVDALGAIGALSMAIIAIWGALMGVAMFFILRGLWPQKADTGYGRDDWERPEEREQAENDVELVPRTRGRMDWQELLVLISAVATVIFMYGQDLLTMIGGGA